MVHAPGRRLLVLGDLGLVAGRFPAATLGVILDDPQSIRPVDVIEPPQGPGDFDPLGERGPLRFEVTGPEHRIEIGDLSEVTDVPRERGPQGLVFRGSPLRHVDHDLGAPPEPHAVRFDPEQIAEPDERRDDEQRDDTVAATARFLGIVGGGGSRFAHDDAPRPIIGSPRTSSRTPSRQDFSTEPAVSHPQSPLSTNAPWTGAGPGIGSVGERGRLRTMERAGDRAPLDSRCDRARREWWALHFAAQERAGAVECPAATSASLPPRDPQ